MKQYALPLLTLLLVGLGGAMPWLAGRMQDERIGTVQERFDLDAVSLTLRQDAGVGPALKVASGDHTSILWEEETQLAEAQALDAAMEAIDRMDRYELLPAGQAEALRKSAGYAEPRLLVSGDGGTALVWDCWWEDQNGIITVDDASGKTVGFLVDARAQDRIDRWGEFFRDYYGIEVANTAELTASLTYGGLVYQYDVAGAFAAGEPEGEALEELSLSVYEDYTSFNF